MKSVLIGFFLIFSPILVFPQSFTIPLSATDGTQYGNITIFWGVHPSATYCIDQALGEVELPPVPVSLDIRFKDIRSGGGSCMGLGLSLDLRPYTSSAQVDTYKVAFQPGDSIRTITLSWPDLNAHYSGAVQWIYGPLDGQRTVDMKAVNSLLIDTDSLTVNSATIIAQGPIGDSTTGDCAALWHFDESSGTDVADASSHHNDGTAIGTTIVPGATGNARSFNGQSDYVYVPNAADGSLNFGANQSFTIEAWFKTTFTGMGEIIRKGLAPLPGYMLRTEGGYVVGTIGDRDDLPPPNALLTIRSIGMYNDGTWHHAVLVRDRSVEKLFLYVDGTLAAAPLDDHFSLSLSNDHPLMIGRWENWQYPTYFNGSIDEVRISRFALYHGDFHRHALMSSSETLDFGLVELGQIVTKDLTLTNVSFVDTLFIDSVSISAAGFSSNFQPLVLTPGSHSTIQVTYAPQQTGSELGTLTIAPRDTSVLPVVVQLSGQGFALGTAPAISSIGDIRDDPGKEVRIRWYPSMYDALSETLRAESYSVWRRVDDPAMRKLILASNRVGGLCSWGGHEYRMIQNDLWDFITTVPAVRSPDYSYVAPTLFNATRSEMHWSVFRVAAHTTNGEFFFSSPDSGYSTDDIFPPPPKVTLCQWIQSRAELEWEQAPALDLREYRVYRSSSPAMAPIHELLVGETQARSFTDRGIAPLGTYYYLVTAVDSSENESINAQPVGLVRVLEVGERGTGIPKVYILDQNYPNPFNPATSIDYGLPMRSQVRLSVFNLLGQEVAVLFDGLQEAGYHHSTWRANEYPSGVYLVRIEAVSASGAPSAFMKVSKMMYLK